MECQVCNRIKHSLLTVTVITKQEKEKDIQMCKECIDHTCDTGMQEWFTLKSDEMVKLPSRVFMRL